MKSERCSGRTESAARIASPQTNFPRGTRHVSQKVGCLPECLSRSNSAIYAVEYLVTAESSLNRAAETPLRYRSPAQALKGEVAGKVGSDA